MDKYHATQCLVEVKSTRTQTSNPHNLDYDNLKLVFTSNHACSLGFKKEALQYFG
jgi:hypothetical protein